jgi:hypothetical protein
VLLQRAGERIGGKLRGPRCRGNAYTSIRVSFTALLGRVVASVSIAPTRDILTLMEDAEDEDLGFAHAVQEPERIDKELANLRISVLWDWRASLSKDAE